MYLCCQLSPINLVEKIMRSNWDIPHVIVCALVARARLLTRPHQWTRFPTLHVVPLLNIVQPEYINASSPLSNRPLGYGRIASANDVARSMQWCKCKTCQRHHGSFRNSCDNYVRTADGDLTLPTVCQRALMNNKTPCVFTKFRGTEARPV